MDKVTAKRYVLVFSSLLTIGGAYCYDNPAALKSQLQQRFHRIPKDRYEFLFNLSYSLYSVPNMILPLFGGLLIDRLGVRLMTVVLVTLVCVGQSIIALGSAATSIELILTGRVLFGIGGETLSIAQTAFITKWFDSHELAFVIGIASSISTVASTLNYKLSPWFADTYHVTTALWIGAGVCGFSVLMGLLLIQIDRTHHRVRAPSTSTDGVSLRDLRRLGRLFWVIAAQFLVASCVGPFTNSAVSLLMERDFFQEPPVACQRCGVGEYTRYCDAISPRCPSAPPFSWPLPRLAKNCSIQTPFDQYRCSKSPPYIQDDGINCDDIAWRQGPFTARYCETKSQAAEAAAAAMGVTSLVPAVLFPLCGRLVDAVGRRPVFATVATLMTAATMLLVGYTRVSVTLPLFLLGASNCLFYASVYPSIPRMLSIDSTVFDLSVVVVPAKSVGTAYGVIVTAANMGAAIVPFLVSAIYARYGHYLPHVQALFIGFSGANVALSAGFMAMDAASNHLLSRCADVSKEALLAEY
ncbi:Aste57867_10818 [Aphanomyces stellatus]|uniref:Lysosomal dipeptide transporter MFSD1 n=1 Tax=Aphanomyces stellatus TaxID=120398 RepID=A0A485KRG8_9STRA|nr:hypothetical protein As57867_010778 [Aphanomyces stellatus]VFT87687.1 Aste57867_10818 [Aphanomyces stellatus]